jgi:hypothetical protein
MSEACCAILVRGLASERRNKAIAPYGSFIDERCPGNSKKLANHVIVEAWLVAAIRHLHTNIQSEVAMASMHPGVDVETRRSSSARGQHPADDSDELREENKQLRELVIQLSKLVVRNVLDRK